MTRLESHVQDSGLKCRVEVRDRLAILIPEQSPGRRLSADQRRQVLQLAKSEGFTHVAIELDPVVAPLSGD